MRPTPRRSTPTRPATSCPRTRLATSRPGGIRCGGSGPWTRTGCTSATTPTSCTAESAGRGALLCRGRCLLDAEPGQFVGPLVAGVARMPLDPLPADLVAVHRLDQAPPQVRVLDRLLG